FALITVLHFGTISFGLYTYGELKFCNKEFPHKLWLIVTKLDVIGVIEDEETFGKLCDEDSIRLLLLLALDVIFIGWLLTCPMDDTLSQLVENLEAWNAFSWGEHIWTHLYDEIKNVIEKHSDEHYFGLKKDRSFINKWLKDRVISELNVHLFKLETVIQVLARERNDEVMRRLQFNEDFPSMSHDFYDSLNILFHDLIDPHDSDEDIANELRLCLKDEEMMRLEQEKIIIEEKRFRLKEAKRLRLEEEKMLHIAEVNKKKRHEFMNSTHVKSILAKLTPSKRNDVDSVTGKANAKDTVRGVSRVGLTRTKPDKAYKVRSKEDDVSRISTSIFVTNFPYLFSAKELFHSCKQYGHVVNTFIPSKRSKAEKRFGFVRFINVFNVERLVNNLCTIWVDRFKFHANIARFHRAPLNGNKFQEKKDVGINRSGTNVPSKDVGVTGTGKSYVHVVKGYNMSRTMECDSILAIVLDDDCLYSKDLSKSLLVLLKFPSTKSKELFHENVRVGSWFSVLRQAPIDFTPEGRIVWVEIEGIPFKLWSGNTFKRIAAKWGGTIGFIFRGKVFWIRAKEVHGWVPNFLDDSDDEDQSDDDFKDGDPKVQDVGSCGDDSDVAEVPETLFEEYTGHKEKQSEDPFGFTPNNDTNEVCMNEENVRSVNDDNPQNCNVDEIQTGQEGNSANKGSKVDVSESVCSGHFKNSEAPRTED
nr:nucleotide-binding alpha-beta plait domain-containing protein [Tanacetum cinerariifolium]